MTLDRPPSPPAGARLASLSPGINLPGWFWSGGDRPFELGARYADDDLARYRDLGIRGVRIPVDPFLITTDPDLRDLVPSGLEALTRCVSRCLALGFAVVVDAHNGYPEPPGGLSGRLQREPSLRARFADYWHRLAARLAALSTDRVLLDALNEPVFDDSLAATAVWSQELAPALVGAIRAAAPATTVLLSGPAAAVPAKLPEMDPSVADGNVAFGVHVYEPYAFTHQGASWAPADVRTRRRVPYPDGPHGRAALAAALDSAADWAERVGVPLAVTEFGCVRWAPPGDRLAWTRDVRRRLERRRVPWMAWTDGDAFGLERPDGTLDRPLLDALGLGVGPRRGTRGDVIE